MERIFVVPFINAALKRKIKIIKTPPSRFYWLIELPREQNKLILKLRDWFQGRKRIYLNEIWVKARSLEDRSSENYYRSKLKEISSKDSLMGEYLLRGNFEFLIGEDKLKAFYFLKRIFLLARKRGIKMTSSSDELGLKKICKKIYSSLLESRKIKQEELFELPFTRKN